MMTSAVTSRPRSVERPQHAYGRIAVCAVAAALLTVAPAPNPSRAAEADLVEQGHDLYDDLCATCHGRDMINAGTLAFDLRKFPKNDFARFRDSVLNGKNQAMPSWRDTLSDEDVVSLWAYVRSGG
jgi:mono/diheme cytochrome c family protein